MTHRIKLLSIALIAVLNVFSQNLFSDTTTFYCKMIGGYTEEGQIWYFKDNLTYERTSGDTTFYALTRETILKKQSADLINLRDFKILVVNNRMITRGLFGGIVYYNEGATIADFSLEKGDTVTFLDPFDRKQNEIKQYVIDDIDYKRFADNSIRKTQHIRPLFDYVGPPIFISEGIGPSNGILGFITEMFQLPNRMDRGHCELISVCAENELKYSNPTFQSLNLAACNADTLKQSILLNTADISLEKGVIYPNPATNKLMLDGLKYDELYIFSYDGRQMGHYFAPSKEIEVGDLPSGIYFIKSVYNKQWSVSRFMKK